MAEYEKSTIDPKQNVDARPPSYDFPPQYLQNHDIRLEEPSSDETKLIPDFAEPLKGQVTFTLQQFHDYVCQHEARCHGIPSIAATRRYVEMHAHYDDLDIHGTLRRSLIVELVDGSLVRIDYLKGLPEVPEQKSFWPWKSSQPQTVKPEMKLEIVSTSDRKHLFKQTMSENKQRFTSNPTLMELLAILKSIPEKIHDDRRPEASWAFCGIVQDRLGVAHGGYLEFGVDDTQPISRRYGPAPSRPLVRKPLPLHDPIEGLINVVKGLESELNETHHKLCARTILSQAPACLALAGPPGSFGPWHSLDASICDFVLGLRASGLFVPSLSVMECSVNVRRALSYWEAKGEDNAKLTAELTKYSEYLEASERIQAAYDATVECIVRRAKIYETDTYHRYSPLIISLQHLSCIIKVSRRSDLHNPIQEAIKFIRERPDDRVWIGISECLDPIQRPETNQEKLRRISRDVDLYRILVTVDSIQFSPGLASSLARLSNELYRQGNLEDSFDSLRECVNLRAQICRLELRSSSEDAVFHREELGASMLTLSSRVGVEFSIEVAVDSTGSQEQLLDKEPIPASHQEVLIEALNAYAARLMNSQRLEDARRELERCNEMRKSLAMTGIEGKLQLERTSNAAKMQLFSFVGCQRQLQYNGREDNSETLFGV